MKSETAIRRALKRWERIPSADTQALARVEALEWVLGFGNDPTLRVANERECQGHYHKEAL